MKTLNRYRTHCIVASISRILYFAAAVFAVISIARPARALEQYTYFFSTGPVTAMDSYGSTIWCGTQFGLVKWDTGDMSYEIYRVSDGLPHASIADVDVASDGSVWVATAENGLARFDGYSWKAYGIADGLPCRNGLSIHAADNGMVYAGVHMLNYFDIGYGLSRFDGDSWTWTRYGSDLYNDKSFVRDITTDANGIVWTVCSGWLASVVDSTWTFYDTNASHIQFDAGGTLWIHTGKSIVRMNNGVFEAYALPNEYNCSDIIALGAPADGGILIMTRYGGLLEMTSDGVVTILAAEETDARFTAMTVDGSGTVWAGLSDGSIARLENRGWSEFSLDEPDISGAAYRLCIDADDIPWMITDNGLFRYDGRRWERIVSAENTPAYGNDPDFNMFFDTDGRLWVLGYYGGYKNIRYLENDRFVADPAIDIYGGVYLAVPDINNGLWVRFNAQENMVRYDNGTLTEIPRPADCIYGTNPIAIDHEGGVWCNTYNRYEQKFYRYFNGVWEPHQEVIVGMEESYVTGIAIAPDWSLWVSVTDNYGDRHYPYLKSRVIHKQVGAELFGPGFHLDSASQIHCVDNQGRLWISLSSGVLRQEGETGNIFREPQGLPDDHVYDIVMDKGNGIWIATGKGVVRYTDETTGIESQASAPASFGIVTAFPNPFNPSTTIEFTLLRQGTVTATVYSIAGQKVRTLASAPMSAGAHRIVWDGLDDAGNSAASGIYCVRVYADRYNAIGKVTLVR